MFISKALRVVRRKMKSASDRRTYIDSVKQIDRDQANTSSSSADWLMAALRNSCEPPRGHEAEWIRKIEARRSSLLSSSEPVEFSDFGAGSPSSNPSEAAMNAGIIKTRTVNDVASASMGQQWARMLFHLCLGRQARSVVEMGSCVGVSGSYLAAALSELGAGRLVTLDGAPAAAKLTNETFAKMGLDGIAACRVGPFHKTLQATLEELDPIDLIFVDGHHHGPSTITYLEQIFPHMNPDGVIVFDDIRWSAGMLEAWKLIAANKGIKRSLDLGHMGIVTGFVGNRKPASA
jgi:predicted O-methyltransferase YrrM